MERPLLFLTAAGCLRLAEASLGRRICVCRVEAEVANMAAVTFRKTISRLLTFHIPRHIVLRVMDASRCSQIRGKRNLLT